MERTIIITIVEDGISEAPLENVVLGMEDIANNSGWLIKSANVQDPDNTYDYD